MATMEKSANFSGKNWGGYCRITYTAGGGTITISKMEFKATNSTSAGYGAYYDNNQTITISAGGQSKNKQIAYVRVKQTSYYASTDSYGSSGFTAVSFSGLNGSTTVSFTVKARSGSPDTLSFSYAIDAGSSGTTITQFDLSSPVGTSNIRVTWSAADNCDDINYSLDGGGWTSPSGASVWPSFDIGELAAGSYHTVKIRVHKSGGSVWNESSAKGITVNAAATITSFNVTPRDETSVLYSYSANVGIDYARYSIDGVNFYDLPNSGVVGGLNAGKGYNFYLQVRRTDNQLWTTSWAFYQETYNYPYVEYVTDFVIGSGNCKANLINPLGRKVALQLISNKDGSEIGRYDGTYSGLVGAEFNTAEAIDKQYRSIPNDQNATYYAKVTFGSVVKTSGSKTYYINNNDSKPTFNLFNWEDVNATTLALTGDSSRVVKGQSNIQATIPVANKATPKNYASITKYEFRCGNVLSTDPMTYSDNADVTGTIPKVSSNTFEVRAVDSRGLPSDWVTLVAQNFIQYENLTKGTATIHREGEVSSRTTVTFDGKVSLVDFGLVQNSVTNVTYQYKTASDADYTTGETTITPTVDAEGNFTFTGFIKGDKPDGFDPQNVYSILVNVFDELSNPYITFALTLQSGTPHLAWHKNGLSVMGKYNETEGGLFQIDGHSIDKQKICVGSQVIFAGVGGTGPVSKTPLLGAYNYSLIDFDTGYGNDSEKYVPSGYHKEYRISYQGTCNGNGQMYIYLNNIKSNGIETWSGASFRIIGITDYFKKSDIVLETTYGYGQLGCNLYYEFDSGSGTTFEIYYITVHEYIVKD